MTPTTSDPAGGDESAATERAARPRPTARSFLPPLRETFWLTLVIGVTGFLVAQWLQTYLDLQNALIDRDQAENRLGLSQFQTDVQGTLDDIRDQRDELQAAVDRRVETVDQRLAAVAEAEARISGLVESSVDESLATVVESLTQLQRDVVALRAESREIVRRNSLKLRELHVQKLRDRAVVAAQKDKEERLLRHIEAVFGENPDEAAASLLRLRRGLERVEARRDARLDEIDMIASTRVVLYRHGAENRVAADDQSGMHAELTRLGFDVTLWQTSADPATPTGAVDAVNEINAEFSGAAAALDASLSEGGGYVVVGPRGEAYAPILGSVRRVVEQISGFRADVFPLSMGVTSMHLTNLLDERIYDADQVILVTRIERWR